VRSLEAFDFGQWEETYRHTGRSPQQLAIR
jgi:hypothetical protein